ncbi:MAG: sigma factor-like helix-turn-helix DNA-binding protein [Phycisphaeraceae bacterium]
MADSKATRVRNYVQALGREDRHIVMLYFADGLTPMEISRVLDLPTTRVRTRLAELRAELGGMTQRKTTPTPAAATAATRLPNDPSAGNRAAYA